MTLIAAASLSGVLVMSAIGSGRPAEPSPWQQPPAASAPNPAPLSGAQRTSQAGYGWTYPFGFTNRSSQIKADTPGVVIGH